MNDMVDLDKIAKRVRDAAATGNSEKFLAAALPAEFVAILDDRDALKAKMAEAADGLKDGTASDGFHSFNELYEYRLLYNAALFNEWARSEKHDVHKSWKHADGEECFGGGWFVVTATVPAGQIGNHYEAKHWDMFKVPARQVAEPWDGHSPGDAARRLASFLGAEKLT